MNQSARSMPQANVPQPVRATDQVVQMLSSHNVQIQGAINRLQLERERLFGGSAPASGKAGTGQTTQGPQIPGVHAVLTELHAQGPLVQQLHEMIDWIAQL